MEERKEGKGEGWYGERREIMEKEGRREAQCVVTLTFTTRYHVLVHVARF